MHLFRQTYAHKDMQEVLQRMAFDRGDSIRILNLGFSGELEHDTEDRLNDNENEKDEAGALYHTDVSLCLVQLREELTR